jgi:alkanesulfonate monooxygenase SsuD/methylene tetrahydromethanopterin reductase-like flavin-dependent oxidoreductase (luciferase family)
LRPFFALYIGGMGARDYNFYTDLAVRYGHEEAAAAIQDAYLDGRRDDAAAAVPDTLIDEVALVGPLSRIIDRLDAWKASRITTLILSTDQPEVLQAVRTAVDPT